jgi:hypothetical protein
MLLLLVIALIYYLITGNSVSIIWSDILKALYIAWIMIDLAKVLTIKAKYVRAIIAMLLLMATFTVWRLYVSPALTNLFFK